METFIHAYLEICPEGQDTVSRDKLVAKCLKMGLKKDKVEQMISVYDVDSDGRICFEEFCRGIGMDLDDMRAERYNRFLNKETHEIAHDIVVVNSSMTNKRIVEITEKFKELVANIPDTEMNISNIIDSFKSHLDQTYKSSWQVIVVYGSYCMKFSHIPFQSLQFVHKKRAVLVWRTPSS